MTTGKLSAEVLQSYAERLATAAPSEVPIDTLLAQFKTRQVSTQGYAYALDVSGETTLDLIEGDPLPQGGPDPVIRDSDWIRLQGICGA